MELVPSDMLTGGFALEARVVQGLQAFANGHGVATPRPGAGRKELPTQFDNAIPVFFLAEHTAVDSTQYRESGARVCNQQGRKRKSGSFNEHPHQLIAGLDSSLR